MHPEKQALWIVATRVANRVHNEAISWRQAADVQGTRRRVNATARGVATSLLRKRGLGYQSIADQLGYTTHTAAMRAHTRCASLLTTTELIDLDDEWKRQTEKQFQLLYGTGIHEGE